jgi:hypothetical protein
MTGEAISDKSLHTKMFMRPSVIGSPGSGAGREQTSGSAQRVQPREPGIGAQTLFDELVGTHKDAVWNRESKCLSGLAVDHQLEFRRLFNRQIGRTGTFQYFVNLGCRPPIQVQVVRPVRH